MQYVGGTWKVFAVKMSHHCAWDKIFQAFPPYYILYMMALAKASAYHGKIHGHYHMHVMPTLYITRVRKFATTLKQALICSLGIISEMLLCLQQYVKTKGISIKHLSQPVTWLKKSTQNPVTTTVNIIYNNVTLNALNNYNEQSNTTQMKNLHTISIQVIINSTQKKQFNYIKQTYN